MESKRAKMTPSEISLFCQQVELLLQAGIPLHEGMRSLAENYQGTPYDAQLKKLAEQVEKTGSLYEGMKDSTLFPVYAKEMIRLGERTGEMEQVCHGLSGYYAREDNIRKAVRNAVTYPLVLVVMMACVIAVLMLRVLPVFRQVLGELGEVSQIQNSGLVSFGMGLGYGVLIVLGVLFLLLLALLIWYRADREKAERFIGRMFPMIRRLRAMMTASRFAGIMEMMLRSGFPLEESMELLDSVFTDEDSRQKIKACRDAIDEGVPFPEAVEKVGIFDPLYGRMIRLGFAAGKTDAVMDKLSEVYEADMDERIGHLVSLIEPTLVTVLSLIIGAILLAVMLPMVSILTTIA